MDHRLRMVHKRKHYDGEFFILAWQPKRHALTNASRNEESSDRSWGLASDAMFYEISSNELNSLWVFKFDVPLLENTNLSKINNTSSGLCDDSLI